MDYLNYGLLLFGLVLSAVSMLGIVVVVGELDNRPPDYYFYSIWASAVACSFGFGWYCAHPLPNIGFVAPMLSNAWGIEHALVFYYYRSQRGTQLPIGRIRVINQYVQFVSFSLLALAVIYGGYSLVEQLRHETQQVKKDLRAVAKIADSTMVRQLTSQNDSLRREVAANRTMISSLTAQVGRQSAQITHLVGLVSDLSGLIADLKKSVRRVDANVDRTRRSVPTPNKIEKAKPPSVEIDPKHIIKTSFNYDPD